MIIEHLGDDLELYEIDSDNEVYMFIDKGCSYTSWAINKEQAIEIINHLKEQFEL